MGYVLRVRLASFFAGAATASFAGIYFLYKDFKVAHDAISQQCYPVSMCLLLGVGCVNLSIILKGRTMVSFFEVESVHESLDRRISSLEKLKQSDAPQPLQATE
ncbi:hypothetical protein OIU78_017363 [Salix suchowensis]|nr:hypothetical protein OIU78_017363 [Salix suchowensis]